MSESTIGSVAALHAQVYRRPSAARVGRPDSARASRGARITSGWESESRPEPHLRRDRRAPGGRGGYYVRAAWDARRDRGGVARQGGRHKRHVCFATLRWHTISVQQPVRHTIPRRLCHPAVCPCGASQGWPVGAVPVQMWQRRVQSRCRCAHLPQPRLKLVLLDGRDGKVATSRAAQPLDCAGLRGTAPDAAECALARLCSPCQFVKTHLLQGMP